MERIRDFKTEQDTLIPNFINKMKNEKEKLIEEIMRIQKPILEECSESELQEIKQDFENFKQK